MEKDGYLRYRNGICRSILSDHILRDEATSAEERQTSFTQMMEIALEIAE